MIKLKGGDGDDKRSIMNQAAKRMNMPMANGASAAGGSSASSAAAAASSSGPTPIAERLGMPSALKAIADRKKGGAQKDWSAHSNRINMGAPVYIKGRSEQRRMENDDDDRGDDNDDDDGGDNNNSGSSSNSSSSTRTSSHSGPNVQHLARSRQTKGVKSDATSNLDWMDEENDLCDPGSDPTAAAIIVAATNKLALTGSKSSNGNAATDANGNANGNADEDADDSDADDDEMRILAELRAKRMQELKKTTGRQQEFLAMGHGACTEVVQDDFLSAVTKSKYVVCHFMHVEFERCKIIDKHLDVLATRHLATRFIKINAERAPFFVQKLQVRMLPSVIMFKDGIAIDRLVGFEPLGGRDDFTTTALEKYLAKSGVLVSKDAADEDGSRKSATAVGSIRAGTHGKRVANDSEDEGEDD